jgi:hypothetical protein
MQVSLGSIIPPSTNEYTVMFPSRDDWGQLHYSKAHKVFKRLDQATSYAKALGNSSYVKNHNRVVWVNERNQ